MNTSLPSHQLAEVANVLKEDQCFKYFDILR